jgi:hypothetical protein
MTSAADLQGRAAAGHLGYTPPPCLAVCAPSRCCKQTALKTCAKTPEHAAATGRGQIRRPTTNCSSGTAVCFVCQCNPLNRLTILVVEHFNNRPRSEQDRGPSPIPGAGALREGSGGRGPPMPPASHSCTRGGAVLQKPPPLLPKLLTLPP